MFIKYNGRKYIIRRVDCMVAKTKCMNIDVTERDYERIKHFADVTGKSVSSLVLDAVWAQMEYHDDLRDIEEYEKQVSDGTLVTYSWSEVQKRAGLCGTN